MYLLGEFKLSKVRNLLSLLSMLVTTFIVPLADLTSLSCSELSKCGSVSIVLFHYLEVYTHAAGIVYPILIYRSKVKLALSSKVASGIIIVYIMCWSTGHTKLYDRLNILAVVSKSNATSRYIFNIVCLIYLLMLAGDIELNPGPVTNIPKKRCAPKVRFMSDVMSESTELLSKDMGQISTAYGVTIQTVKLWIKALQLPEMQNGLPPKIRNWADGFMGSKAKFMSDVKSNKFEVYSMSVPNLASHYGVTEHTVRIWLKSVDFNSINDHSLPQTKGPDVKQRFMVEVYGDCTELLSKSTDQVITEFNITPRVLKEWLKEIKCSGTKLSLPVNNWLQSLLDSTPPVNLLLDELTADLGPKDIADIAIANDVSERYVTKCVTDLKRANFVSSSDVDLPDDQIAQKYGIRKATVASWKAEANTLWMSWFDVVELDEGPRVEEPIPIASHGDLYPHCLCYECGVILFESDVQWVDKNGMRIPYRATQFQYLSFNLSTAERDVRGQPRVGSCRHCACRASPENLFDNFGVIPDCIKAVAGFSESRRLALGSLYCSTFKPSNYSYVHCSGKMGFSMNTAHLKGMAGILKFGDPSEGDITAPYNREAVLTAFSWLRKNNPLYNQFMAQLETLYGYFQTTRAGGLGNPVPLVNECFTVETGYQISADDVVDKEGMFVLTDPDETIPRGRVSSKELNSNVGRQIPREPPKHATIEALCEANKLNLYDPDLEHKLFPHLYPYARGGYASLSHSEANHGLVDDTEEEEGGEEYPSRSHCEPLTLGKYIKMRLLHADPRWRHDRLWPFFAYDWLMKNRISGYNLKTTSTSSEGRALPISKQFLLSDLGQGERTFDRIGQFIPPKLPGTKSYWSKEYLDLMAFCEHQGMPDYFVTLTANDSWPGLKDMLEGVATHFRPVESTLFFMQKYRKVKELLWGRRSVFGQVTDHWQRIEFQNRGALHVHMLIWVAKEENRHGKIVATVPRSHREKELRAKVLKYQVHDCREGRCYKKGQRRQCKYGYPYALLDRDCMDDSGVRYNYARLEKEDVRIVSYNKDLLEAWDAHINVQRVTKLGLVKYLVKYVSKTEPTFTAKVREDISEVEKYFNTRLIGAPEVATTLLSYQIAGGTRNVMFLDTNPPDKQRRVLKPVAHLHQLESGSTDVFLDSFRDKYCARPESLDSINYQDYLAGWEVFTDISKVPMRRRSRSHKDKKDRVVAPRDKKVLPRKRFLTPLDGEDYYYQLLLIEVPFRSEGDLMSEDNVSKTYKEECFLRGLTKQDEDALASLEEASNRNFNIKYIHRIAKMLILKNMGAQEAVNEKLRGLGLGEVNVDDGDHDNEDDWSKQCHMLDHPPGEAERSDLIRLLGHNPVSIVSDEQELRERVASLKPSQMEAFQLMTDLSEKQRLLFVTGPGGTGKSFLIHTVVAQLAYCQGKFVEVLATSGPAAYLLHGSTIHRFFRLDIEMKSRLELGTVDCSAVANCDVIIVDECSMMSARLFSTMHSLCCYATTDPAKRELPFAGKSVYLFGDLFQLPAIESPQLYQSPLWQKFTMVKLRENCRQACDVKYGDVLNRIRTGDHTEDDLDYLAGRVCGVGHEKGADCELSTNCTVLCSKHEHKDKINLSMLNSLGGECVTLRSTDVDSSGVTLNRGQLQVLENMRGVPPAELKLKVGARVVVTRNLDVAQGVVNGTIGTVENIQPNLITIRRCSDGDLMCVQPIKHVVKLKGTSNKVVREQFPLILAWAVTIHRVQGMTLSTNVYVYMDSSFFAQGQAYVALSRVKAYNQLHLLSFDPHSAIKVSHTVRGLYGLPRRHNEFRSQFMPVHSNSTLAPSADQQLPSIATTECMEYLIANMSDHNKLIEYMQANSHNIEDLITALKSIDRCTNMTLRPVARTSESNLHPALLEVVTPITTTGDGNCFWNAISILLCGRETLTMTLRFLTAYGLVRYKPDFLNVIHNESIIMDPETFPTDETRYLGLLDIALRNGRWAENEHFLALSIALDMPVYVFSGFKDRLGVRHLIDPSLSISQLQQYFASRGQFCFNHKVYCSNRLYESNMTRLVHEFDHPPLCVHLHQLHFTALKYVSLDALRYMPALTTRVYHISTECQKSLTSSMLYHNAGQRED